MQNKIVLFLILSCLCQAINPHNVIAQPQSVSSVLESWYQQSRSKLGSKAKLGVIVTDMDRGEQVFAKEQNTLLTPASIVKLITSAVALKTFTGAYRFPTEVFADRKPDKAGSVGNIYIRGYGDPSMVNERMSELARLLSAQGVKQVRDVVVDDSLFVDPPAPTGSDPYAAGLSATSLNHNSYAIDIAPSEVGAAVKASVMPADLFIIANQVRTVAGAGSKVSVVQTPVSGSKSTSAAGPVRLTLTGSYGSQRKPESIYQSVPAPSIYYGASFKNFLKNHGVVVAGAVRQSVTPSAATLLRSYQSEDLAIILRDLNNYSNNYIAGQVVFALGQDSVGLFHYQKGLERIRSYLGNLGLNPDSYQIYDGSGLDRRTKLSAAHFAKVMFDAYRDLSIAPEYLSSLSRFQLSGTLKRRSLPGISTATPKSSRDFLARSVWAKTGTLDGVSSLAGYLRNSSGRTLAFVIIINGHQHSDHAKQVEEQLVRTLIER